MSAAEKVRSALMAALSAEPMFDGVAGLRLEPTAGSLPSVEVALPGSGDWSTKTEDGRELRTIVTLRVAKGQRDRLLGLVDAAEHAGSALRGTLDGWSVASAILVRTQVGDERDGLRIARVEHRIRVLKK